ncbi:hypothetical protein DFQ27_003914 [Actinomortierella ambigua]|uniref:Peptidase A1 domain-containing protein n=1 Tax=Actinomortierella ambigua TaxID=1343610 RepID=A0A9P6Q3B5_9FUNG|nr:hypothetical protein DFQ26_000042 [Actinomortierella ambigua]KAG0259736.1 hypothetical protein DFQ27_003914 [Actinomortierella ambigua]
MTSSLSLGAEGAVFEVLVERPSTPLDPSSHASAPLRMADSNGLERLKLGEGTVMSKYLGNSIVTNARNLGYAGTIQLGEPPQSFQVVFDTGSDMIVVISNMCQGMHCNDMTQYTCTSCARTPYSYNITYGDGTWGAGPIVTDTVSLGGLVVKNQQILDITKSGLDLSGYGNGVSGLVGLMPHSPVARAIPPLQTIYENKLLDQNVFSVYLTSSLTPKQGGSFLFGGIDTSKFSGDLNWVPLSTAPSVREGMWYIEADNALAGTTPVAGYKQSPWLFDTGTSFIAVPTTFAQEFHKLIPGSSFSATDQVYTVPCTGNTSFAVSFQGQVYEVPYLDYIARASGGGPNSCVSLVMPLGNYEMYILGDPFLRQVYAVYDFNTGASRIGLAKVNVKNGSLGNEGLSGGPVPGGGVIAPLDSAAPATRTQHWITVLMVPILIVAGLIIL